MTRHSVNNNTCMDLVIFLCPNSNHLIFNTPQTASNFKHLLGCDTIVAGKGERISFMLPSILDRRKLEPAGYVAAYHILLFIPSQ